MSIKMKALVEFLGKKMKIKAKEFIAKHYNAYVNVLVNNAIVQYFVIIKKYCNNGG